MHFIENFIHFLTEHLSLTHTRVDFLGWVHFPNHRVLRTVTKNRMFRNIKIKEEKEETVQSYLGLLGHGNTEKLRAKILNPGSMF